MILAFEFSGASENLGFFLEFYARDLKHSFVKNDDILTLFVSADKDDLLKFSDTIGENLPHFVFLRDSKVYICDELKGGKMDFKNSFSNITPAQILSYKNGNLSSCENGIFSDTQVFINNEFIAVNHKNFSELLKFAVMNFLSKITLKDSILGEFSICDLNGDFNAIIPTKLTNLPAIFSSTQNEQIALASYEKPAINLKIKSLQRQKFGGKMFFDVVAARDIFIYALCDELSKKGIEFIGLKSEKLFKAVILENGFLCSGLQNYIDKKINSNDDVFNKVYEKLDEKDILNVFLSKKYVDKINLCLAKTKIDFLNLIFPNSFDELFTMIKSDEGGERLLQNYQKQFKLPSGEITANNSFFGLFGLAGVILGFNSDFAKSAQILLDYASDFSLSKGVRVDFKQEKTYFSIVKFTRSVMSFALAGADAKNISYGVIESFVYFLSDLAQKAKDDFGIKNIILQGSLFENKTLTNLVSKHLSLVAKTHFGSQNFLEI